MLDVIRRMRLKTKIFLSCVSIVIVLIVSSSVLLYSYVTSEITKTYYENISDVLVQTSNYMDERLKSTLGRINAMRLNGNFDKTMREYLYYNTSYLNAAAISQFSESFAEIRGSDSFISSVFMHTSKSDFFDLASHARYGMDFTATKIYKIISEDPNKLLYWGERGEDEFYNSNKIVIPEVFRFSLNESNEDAILVINLDEQAILNYLAGVQPGDANWTIILDNQGNKIASFDHPVINALDSDTKMISTIMQTDSGSQEVRLNGRDYIVTFQTMNFTPWKIINIKSQSTLTEKINKLKFYTVVLMLISIFICFLLALILSGSLTKPLSLLEKTVIKVSNKNFDITFDYKYPNEFGKLAVSFNYMVSEIKDLIEKLNVTVSQLQEEKEKVRIEQLLKRRAELKALQAQINPHFLYNTLDSINWKANEIHAEEICQMTTALASLFRTSLSRGQEIITLEEEIKQSSSYLIIQKMRYGDKFNYHIHMDESILGCYTVKLILQPLIENAIYHGIKEKDGAGMIEIRGERAGDRIRLLVTDDGVGIPPMKLELINKRLKERIVVDKNGYGIYNVNERIQLYFGLEYGLKFSSRESEGTTVEVFIPEIKREDVENYVQYFGS